MAFATPGSCPPSALLVEFLALFNPFLPSPALAIVAFQAGTVLTFRTSRTSLGISPGAGMAPEMPPLQSCLAGVASMEQPKYVSSGAEACHLNHSIPGGQVCREYEWVPIVLTWVYPGTHEHITFPLSPAGGISICSLSSSDPL